MMESKAKEVVNKLIASLDEDSFNRTEPVIALLNHLALSNLDLAIIAATCITAIVHDTRYPTDRVGIRQEVVALFAHLLRGSGVGFVETTRETDENLS